MGWVDKNFPHAYDCIFCCYTCSDLDEAAILLRCTGETLISTRHNLTTHFMVGPLALRVFLPHVMGWTWVLCHDHLFSAFWEVVGPSAAMRNVFDNLSVGESRVLKSPTIKGLMLIYVFNSISKILCNWVQQRLVHICLEL